MELARGQGLFDIDSLKTINYNLKIKKSIKNLRDRIKPIISQECPSLLLVEADEMADENH